MRFPEDRLVTDAATLQLARQALKDHAWADAYEGFVRASAEQPGALAEGGEIVVTCETMEPGSIPHPVGEERVVSLKGIARPVRVVASIDWRPGSL
jgi:hypothetical protein